MWKEIRFMCGPNMWSTKHHYVIAIKYFPIVKSEIDEQQKDKIIRYFRTNFQIEPQQEDFNISLFHYFLQMVSVFQGPNYYQDFKFPSKGILYGVVEYKIKEVAVAALATASQIVASLLNDLAPISIEEVLTKIKTVSVTYSNDISTTIIIDSAKKRKIPISIDAAGYTILGFGKNQKKINAAMSHYTSCIAVNIAGNKDQTKKLLEAANISVPMGIVVINKENLIANSSQLGFPLVTKPLNSNQGRNVTCNITDNESLLIGFDHAKEVSKSVIIEKQIEGNHYRLLVIGNKLRAASLRVPAFIVGDGLLSINELVDQENHNQERDHDSENKLTRIKIDSVTDSHLQKQGFTSSSIPKAGQQVLLKSATNINTEGTADDLTDFVHASNKFLAEQVSRIIGLDICGIDIISPDISVPLADNGGAVIEVHATPDLKMHPFPGEGISRDIGNNIIDLMFQKKQNGRIPIVAITGTNGKTTTTRLMAHVASYAGNCVGFSSTDGIYIGHNKIKAGDCSGPQSAKIILQDTTVDFAVLECARGGIIRSGLGFDTCDIAIVTNVAADHLGQKDIHTVEDLAAVKSVVPMSVKKKGWAIVNAADALAHAMKNKVKCKVALFCTDEKNENLQQHIKNGGYVVYTDSKLDIYIGKKKKRKFIFNAADAPITCHGQAGFMIENLLPVILASYLLGIRKKHIVAALTQFIPSAEETPGRINNFKINGVNVMVDYAHNPHGLKALSAYLQNIKAKKLGIITGTGDRREEDIIEFGRIAASTYDEIIIRLDRDLRGRTSESIIELLTIGIRDIHSQKPFQVIPDMEMAIVHAITSAEKDSYVVISADDPTFTVNLVKKIALKFQK